MTNGYSTYHNPRLDDQSLMEEPFKAPINLISHQDDTLKNSLHKGSVEVTSDERSALNPTAEVQVISLSSKNVPNIDTLLMMDGAVEIPEVPPPGQKTPESD